MKDGREPNDIAIEIHGPLVLAAKYEFERLHKRLADIFVQRVWPTSLEARDTQKEQAAKLNWKLPFAGELLLFGHSYIHRSWSSLHYFQTRPFA